jgi:branched-chain amino acid transport system substrate-binding protein
VGPKGGNHYADLTRTNIVAGLVSARRTRFIACVGATILGTAAPLAAGSSTPARAQDVVKLGNIEAQTGALNTYGWMSSQGVRMAVDKINKGGGFQVGGKTYKLQLVNPDTQGNPQQALIELKKMLEDQHVNCILGPFLTKSTRASSPMRRPPMASSS